GLGESLRGVGDATHFAGEPDFSKDDRVRGKGFPLSARGHRHRDAEIARGLTYAYASGDVYIYVLGLKGNAYPLLQYGKYYRDPIGVGPRHLPARRSSEGGLAHERLYFHQQRPGSLPAGRDDRTGRALRPLGQKELRRIGYRRQPVA